MTDEEKEFYLILHGWQVKYMPDFERNKSGTINMNKKILIKYYFGPRHSAVRDLSVAYNIETVGPSVPGKELND